MKIVSTIEARMTSSRLPGKVMLQAAGKPMIAHLIDRLRCVPSLNEIIVATTTNSTDDGLVDFVKSCGASAYRGSEDDVMSRVLEAAEAAKADIVVEITGDCPVLDPAIVAQHLDVFLNNDVDYVDNVVVPGYPIGQNVQVFKTATLRKSFEMTTHPLDREHVTRHIRMHPEIFRQIHLMPLPAQRWDKLGLALDEPNDYLLLKKIIEHFSESDPKFSCEEILRLLRDVHPEWLQINQTVYRKSMHE